MMQNRLQAPKLPVFPPFQTPFLTIASSLTSAKWKSAIKSITSGRQDSVSLRTLLTLELPQQPPPPPGSHNSSPKPKSFSLTSSLWGGSNGHTRTVSSGSHADVSNPGEISSSDDEAGTSGVLEDGEGCGRGGGCFPPLARLAGARRAPRPSRGLSLARAHQDKSRGSSRNESDAGAESPRSVLLSSSVDLQFFEIAGVTELVATGKLPSSFPSLAPAPTQLSALPAVCRPASLNFPSVPSPLSTPFSLAQY